MAARNRVGKGLSYRLARLHMLAELINWNRCLGSIKVKKFGLCFFIGGPLVGDNLSGTLNSAHIYSSSDEYGGIIIGLYSRFFFDQLV